jgi:leader peptidase (prepilin peptidase)/N-methyltransferase
MTSKTDVLAALVGVLGLVIGSFLNVVIYRVPRGMSLVRPGSACPSCGAPIRWFDNVPVLSWIALRGRCRRCRGPISVRYPLVELATGMIFAALILIFGRT